MSTKYLIHAEGVEFTTAGEYETKLKLIRESYFSQVKNGTGHPRPRSIR